MIRTRAPARYGLDVKVGVASTWALAAMASNETGPGGIRTVGATREDVEAFLYPRPVGEMYGIGPAQARTLTAFGVHTIGILATLPESTVQRILGGRSGRLIHERAKGIDRRAVVPSDLPYSTSAQRRFTIDTLDPTTVRAALLSLAVELGDRLRSRQQAARTVTLTVTLAGRSQITRSRRLQADPPHTPTTSARPSTTSTPTAGSSAPGSEPSPPAANSSRTPPAPPNSSPSTSTATTSSAPRARSTHSTAASAPGPSALRPRTDESSDAPFTTPGQSEAGDSGGFRGASTRTVPTGHIA
ncbi:hypothetical protein ABTY00_26775 [Streptomyces microflavus]|uniref:DNA polymerase Y family protein n=1 Tax=Streptomyces microflavus TaxID=1919 RepID=UPI003318316E